MPPDELNISTLPPQGEKPLLKFPLDYSDLLKKFEFQTNIVIGVFIVALVTLMCMVGGILVDASHFNSAVYKDYSEKIDTLDQLQATNKELQNQIQGTQQTILGQQQDILNKLTDISKQKK